MVHRFRKISPTVELLAGDHLGVRDMDNRGLAFGVVDREKRLARSVSEEGDRQPERRRSGGGCRLRLRW